MQERIIIEGGKPLYGRVRISGAKNAALVLIVASILADGETILDNVPHIRDVEVMLHILRELGVATKWNDDNSLSINPPAVMKTETPYELAKKLRASNLFLGAFLGRTGQALISLPGGCDIGSRPMDLHIKGVQSLGGVVEIEHGYISARMKKPQGSSVYLDFPSVGATENIMMLASKTPGVTTIENAAREPEIVDLSNFINTMGGKVRGAGTDLIKIEGVERLTARRYAIIPDRIEAGTYMVAAAITRGEVLVENIIPTHLHPIIAKLQETGVLIREHEKGLVVKGINRLRPIDIKTMPYPGFPTDMQSQMMALMAIAEGTSVIVENVFENRFQVVDEFTRMGAKIKVEGHTAIVEGVKTLCGARVKSPDLRAGAALILMALAARDETRIDHAVHIFRGYENIIEKIKGLGGNIKTE